MDVRGRRWERRVRAGTGRGPVDAGPGGEAAAGADGSTGPPAPQAGDARSGGAGPASPVPSSRSTGCPGGGPGRYSLDFAAAGPAGSAVLRRALRERDAGAGSSGP